ncbi:MAG TPA: PilZ domain-containing protein, partial [Turneriella sp.]|nr:PilZ domain-containing protein [Turneriella sp.]
MQRASEQKRQQGRLKVIVNGQYRFKNDGDWMACQVFDISAGGIAIGGKESFYAGDVIELRFSVENYTLFMTIEITNLTGRKAGGKIIDIGNEDKKAL